MARVLLEEDISKISHILGDDMLSMEEKESLFKTIKEVNDDERLLKDWILEDNEKMKFHGQMAYAREEGIKEGIKEGEKVGAEAEKTEVIKIMLKRNYNYEEISMITNKSIEEIKEIEKNM